jgi:hypothetical protein
MTKTSVRALALALALSCAPAMTLAQTQPAPTAKQGASTIPRDTQPTSIFVAPAGGVYGPGRAVAEDKGLPIQGRDSSSGNPCVIGSTSTCVMPGTGGGGGGGGTTTKSTAAAPSLVEGDTTNQISVDLHGAARTLIQTQAGGAVDWTAPVIIAGTDGATAASNSNAVPVGVQGTVTVTGTVNAVPAAATGQGADGYTFEVAASDNHQTIKNGAGTVYSIDAFSIHTAAMFIRLYDAGTGFNGCGSATGLMWEGNLPGAATGDGFIKTFPVGRKFTTGLSVCVTGAFGSTDTTAATATKASVNIGYK